jgi:folate-dependent tRNA-U54 methylase TrmFO/GidA
MASQVVPAALDSHLRYLEPVTCMGVGVVAVATKAAVPAALAVAVAHLQVLQQQVVAQVASTMVVTVLTLPAVEQVVPTQAVVVAVAGITQAEWAVPVDRA